ncbi:MAG: diguanylate cyclase [Desulfuromonas sp.]|nr:diguanylate cyclase [Desulfuromonas sp.]
MIIECLDKKIKLEKRKLQLYIFLGTLLPVVVLTIFLSFIYLNNLKKLNACNLSQLSKNILAEKKIFLHDAIERTLAEIDHIRKNIVLENSSSLLSDEEIAAISREKIADYIRDLRLTDEKYYLWINHIIDYNGGDGYAVRLVHPNLLETEGALLSTNTQDIEGNTPYKTELEQIKKEGELYYEYYFKKLGSDEIAHKLSFAKLYKPFDWVVATGIYLDDLDELIQVQKDKMQQDYTENRNISIVLSLILILCLIIALRYFQAILKKIIISYEGKIENYTKKLEAMATTDQLTGLRNRLELNNIYEVELEKAKRYHKQFSIIMLDVDYFKKVNDIYGHPVGDGFLQELACILKTSVRVVDSAGRWGGEEFLIICPETDLNGAVELAEHLRLAIAAYDFAIVGRKTSSFGVSSYHENDTRETMLERADDALYCAKADGRNLVRAEKYQQ